jgi:hypothetical protein
MLGHITSEQFYTSINRKYYRFPISRNVRSSLSEYALKKFKVQKNWSERFTFLAWFSDVLAVLEFSNFKSIFTNTAAVLIRISTV